MNPKPRCEKRNSGAREAGHRGELDAHPQVPRVIRVDEPFLLAVADPPHRLVLRLDDGGPSILRAVLELEGPGGLVVVDVLASEGRGDAGAEPDAGEAVVPPLMPRDVAHPERQNSTGLNEKRH